MVWLRRPWDADVAPQPGIRGNKRTAVVHKGTALAWGRTIQEHWQERSSPQAGRNASTQHNGRAWLQPPKWLQPLLLLLIARPTVAAALPPTPPAQTAPAAAPHTAARRWLTARRRAQLPVRPAAQQQQLCSHLHAPLPHVMTDSTPLQSVCTSSLVEPRSKCITLLCLFGYCGNPSEAQACLVARPHCCADKGVCGPTPWPTARNDVCLVVGAALRIWVCVRCQAHLQIQQQQHLRPAVGPQQHPAGRKVDVRPAGKQWV